MQTKHLMDFLFVCLFVCFFCFSFALCFTGLFYRNMTRTILKDFYIFND